MLIRILTVVFLLFISPLIVAVPDIHSWQTQTGAKVLFVESLAIPIIDIQVIFDAGSARNDAHLAGLASLTNNLLDEGADGLTADQISQGFADIGAQYGASSGRDYASISLRSLSDSEVLEQALTTLTRVLTKPDFPAGAFNRQKNRMLIRVRNKQQSPSAVAKDAFLTEVFRDHPYATEVSGTELSIHALTREAVIDFYKRYYVTKNATIAIVGDLTKVRAQLIAESLFGDLPIGEVPEALEPVLDIPKATTISINHPSLQTHVLLGQTGLKYGEPDYFPLYVGNHVLGGSGMVSRLFEEVREKRGLAYSVYSYFAPMKEKGFFMVGLQTRVDQVQEALMLLRNNLEKFIQDGPNAEELEMAKKNITGGFALRLDSNSKILSYLGVIGFYDLPYNYLDTFNDKVNAVTAEQIMETFQRRLALDKFATVLVGGKGEAQNNTTEDMSEELRAEIEAEETHPEKNKQD